MSVSKPTTTQVRKTRAVVSWYMNTHYGRSSDVGLLPTFCFELAIGHMAVDADAVARGDEESMFRLFVTVAMFQVLRNALVMRILRGLSADETLDTTKLATLVSQTTENACSP